MPKCSLKAQKVKKSTKLTKNKGKVQPLLSEDEKIQNVSISYSNPSTSSQSDNEESESSVVQPAIKTMVFRAIRGTKMKDLIEGKIPQTDKFWEQNRMIFGGNLNSLDQEEDESDYEASSSGEDSFDSDFDQYDTYPRKRGIIKGKKCSESVISESSSQPQPPRKSPEKKSKKEPPVTQILRRSNRHPVPKTKKIQKPILTQGPQRTKTTSSKTKAQLPKQQKKCDQNY